MERKGLSMKNHHQRTNISMRNPTSNIMKSQSNHNNNIPKDHTWSHGYNSQNYEEDYIVNGFSWPPRSYSCSFCKREFRSAQALGGHMNVHRKDRARLRQSPPRDLARYGGTSFLNLNLNPNPNPNPNFSPSLLTTPLSSYSAYCPNNENKKWSWTSTTNHVEYGSTDHDQVLDPLAINGSDLARNVKNKQSVCGVGENEGFAGKTLYFKGLKKAAHETTTVRLDLEIGLVDSDSKMGRDLDLELRLGYSN